MRKTTIFILACLAIFLFPIISSTAEENEIETNVKKIKTAIAYLENKIIYKNLDIKKAMDDIDLVKIYIKNFAENNNMNSFKELRRVEENQIVFMEDIFIVICKKETIIHNGDGLLIQYGKLIKQFKEIISEIEKNKTPAKNLKLNDVNERFLSAANGIKKELTILEQKNQETESACEEFTHKLFEKIKKKEKNAI